MRIISGKYRGRNIISPKGRNVRPSASLVRESVFNILSSRLQIDDSITLLDLCCGTGSMGLEAISRGVEDVTFVDTDTTCVEQNLQNFALKHDHRKQIIRADVARFVANIPTDYVYDICIIDPPYQKVMSILQQVFSPHALAKIFCRYAIIEMPSKTDVVLPNIYKSILERKYGNTKIVFIGLCDDDFS